MAPWIYIQLSILHIKTFLSSLCFPQLFGKCFVPRHRIRIFCRLPGTAPFPWSLALPPSLQQEQSCLTMCKGSHHQISSLGQALSALTRTQLSGHQLVVVQLVLKENCVIAFSCTWEIEWWDGINHCMVRKMHIRFETKRKILFPLPLVLFLKSLIFTVHNCVYMPTHHLLNSCGWSPPVDPWKYTGRTQDLSSCSWTKHQIVNRGQLLCRH